MARGRTERRVGTALWRWCAALALLAGLLAGWLPLAGVARAAAICQVTTTADAGAGSLRQCLLDVDPGGTITFALSNPSTITLTTGQLAVDKALTIQGPGADRLTISGNNASRVFSVSGGPVTIGGLTAANGYTTANLGAAIYSSGTLTLTAVQVRASHATNAANNGVGGGVGNNGGTLTILASTIAGNTIDGFAGGGGVGNNGGTLTIANSTIVGNTAQFGGGIYGKDGAATLLASTVADNSGTYGANISVYDAALTARGLLVAEGQGPGNCTFGSTTLDVRSSLDDGITCGFDATAGNRSGQPAHLGPLAANGGPTPTRTLLGGSPAIDAGDATACAADPVAGVDQRGVARPQGVACDIGAYEVAALPAPTLAGVGTATTPAVASGAADLTITLTGANFQPDGFSVATINGTPVATTYVSATQLTAQVPASLRATAGQYPLTVTNGPPGGGTSNPVTFTVANPAPALGGLAPVLAGTSTPGVLAGSAATTLTLTGTSFAPGATVDFGGTILTPTAANVAATSIAVTVPASLLATARDVQVAVTNPGPGGGTSESLAFTVANATPTLTDSNPTTAVAGQGDTALAVSGTGFAPGTTLTVGGTTLATTLTSTTQAQATIPAAMLRAAGTLAITVAVPGPGGGTAGGRTLVVNPATAAQLAATAGSPQSAAVTTPYATPFQVAVRDQYGNPVADGTVVTFTAPGSGPSGTFAGTGTASATATTTGGVATAPTFTANGVAGTYTILVSAGGGAVPVGLTNTPGPVAALAVTALATSVAGAPVSLTVTARDAQGNTVTTYTGTVHVTSTDPQATLPADYPFVAGDGGTHGFGATLRTAGAQTLTVADTTNAGVTGSATIAVSAATPATLSAAGGTPQTRAIGQAFAPLAARMMDAYGNPVAGVAVTFAASASGASATFPGSGASVTVTTGADGVATAPTTTANTVAGGYAVVASGAGGSASFALTNTPGPATRLDARGPVGTAQAGTPVAVTVTAHDAGGNVATGYTGTLHIASGDPQATLPVDYTYTAGDAGTHTFTVTLRTGGTQTVTATDTANGALTTSATFAVAAPATATVTASATGQGTISPSGASTYTGGSVASYSATPAAGQVFVGWTLDGRYVGYASPLTFTVNVDRTLVATFAATPTFTDVPASDPDYQAITTLAALGIVNPAGVNGSGQFQPGRAVARAEVAAFIARVFGWEREFHGNPFPDKCDPAGAQGCVDDRLWNDVAALRDYGVVGGYTDSATCRAGGTTAPCYLPRESVLKVQVVSIVARAFTTAPDLRPTGFWDRLAANASQDTNVPDTGSQRSDLATYRANAGAIPGQASDATFPQPTDPATRRFVIEVLWQAYSSVYGTDRVP